jgi:hypothetical protein
MQNLGREPTGASIQPIDLPKTFRLCHEIIGATPKYIVYAFEGSLCGITYLIVGGRIRIIDRNSGMRAFAETPSSYPIISLNITDGSDGKESFLLALDSAHELTVWSIQPWQIASTDVPYYPLSHPH